MNLLHCTRLLYCLGAIKRENDVQHKHILQNNFVTKVKLSTVQLCNSWGKRGRRGRKYRNRTKILRAGEDDPSSANFCHFFGKNRKSGTSCICSQFCLRWSHLYSCIWPPERERRMEGADEHPTSRIALTIQNISYRIFYQPSLVEVRTDKGWFAGLEENVSVAKI